MKSNTMSAFRAIVWKELRENWYWAVGLAILIFIVSSKNIAAALTYPHLGSLQTFLNANWSVLSVTVPVFSLAMGLNQFLPERHSDRWAFLLHRPVSRDTIFIGKAVVGMGLIAAAVGVPIMCIGFWMSRNGNFPAPWDWALLIPYIAIFMSAIGMYMSAVYVSTRRSRWIGSRVLPIVGAAAVALLASTVPETFVAFALSSAFAGVATYAAKGSVAADGIFVRAGRIGQCAQLITVWSGLFVLGGLPYSFVLTEPEIVVRTAHQPLQIDEVSDDGLVVIHHEGIRSTEGYYTDLNGQRVQVDATLNRHDLAPQGWVRTKTVYEYSTINHHVFPILNTVTDPEREHFLVYYDKTANVLSKYSTWSRACVGSITETGFHKTLQALQYEPQQIIDVGYDSVEILTEHQLTLVNVLSGTATAIYIAAPGETLKSFSRIMDSQSLLEWVIVGSDGLVVEVSGQKQSHIAAFPTEQQVNTMSLYRARAGKVIIRYGKLSKPRGVIFDTYSAAGRLISHESAPDFAYSGIVINFDQSGLRIANSMCPLALSSFMAASYSRDAAVTVHHNDAPGSESARLAALNAALPISALLSLLCILPAWLYSRWAGLSTTAKMGWSIGMVPLGWLGLLLMISMISLPARESCSQCGKKREVNMELCRHCGAAWPVPKFDGTEIFDGVSSEGLSIVGASSGQMEQNR